MLWACLAAQKLAGLPKKPLGIACFKKEKKPWFFSGRIFFLGRVMEGK